MMKKVLDFCKKYNIFTGADSVLVGVSGGCDSMCLLHLLSSLADELGITVYAAHFNHNLRGEESDGDEAFVREYCERIGVCCTVGSGDVRAYSVEHSLGIEEAARVLRYNFFYETAEKLGVSRIATAHNADDNLETMLLNLTRGSGLKGLCGIPPVRDNIVRPLLSVTRSEIEAYVAEHAVPYRLDSSNLSDDYSRNKLRHLVVPVLRELNPNVSLSSATTASLLTEDEKYLTSLAEKYIETNFSGGRLSASSLLNLPTPVSSRVIRILCGSGLSAGHVDSVFSLATSASPSASVSLPGMTLRREYDNIVFSAVQVGNELPTVTLPENGSVVIDELGLRFTCEKTVQSDIIHKSLTNFVFKCDNLIGNISIRSRTEGDAIRLSPSGGRKTLKKLFIEKKIPVTRRGTVPVIADENGPIAVYGLGQDINTLPSSGDTVIKVKIEEIRIYD